jgi:hypothetical protein
MSNNAVARCHRGGWAGRVAACAVINSVRYFGGFFLLLPVSRFLLLCGGHSVDQDGVEHIHLGKAQIGYRAVNVFVPHGVLHLHQVTLQSLVHASGKAFAQGMGPQLAHELVAIEGFLEDAPGLLTADGPAESGVGVPDPTTEYRGCWVQLALQDLARASNQTLSAARASGCRGTVRPSVFFFMWRRATVT